MAADPVRTDQTAPTTAALVDRLLERIVDVEQLDEAATAAARRLVLDVLGVAVAGASTVEGRLILETMTGAGRPGGCAVPLSGRTFDPATAALVTGTMAYSIGLTDTHATSITHPGPSVVPVALAVGQDVGATDDQILRAVALGVETVVRIGAVVNPSHRSRGFHPTATCNPFGAAVAAAYLLGADRRQLLWALGLTGSMAGGLYEFRHEGSMLMALHGGWPAHSGIVAAQLAMSGFTGPTTVLEGPEGFFRGYADHIRPEELLAGGDRLGIEELSMRPYCACRYAHAGVDALQQMAIAHGPLPAGEIEKITVWTHKTAVDQESAPTSLVSARLSTCFTIALAAIHGPRLVEVSEDDLRDRQVLDLVERTEVVEDPELTALFPKRWSCRVRVELRDGRAFEERVDTPLGEPDNPMTPDQLAEKFQRLAVPAIGEVASQATVRSVLGDDGDRRLATVLNRLGDPNGEGNP